MCIYHTWYKFLLLILVFTKKNRNLIRCTRTRVNEYQEYSYEYNIIICTASVCGVWTAIYGPDKSRKLGRGYLRDKEILVGAIWWYGFPWYGWWRGRVD